MLKVQSLLRSLRPVAVRSKKAEILHVRSLRGVAVRTWRCRRWELRSRFNAVMARTLTWVLLLPEGFLPQRSGRLGARGFSEDIFLGRLPEMRF